MNTKNTIWAAAAICLLLSCSANHAEEGVEEIVYDFYEYYSPVPPGSPVHLTMSHEYVGSFLDRKINLKLSLANTTADTLYLLLEGWVGYNFVITTLDSLLTYSPFHVQPPDDAYTDTQISVGDVGQFFVIKPESSIHFNLPWPITDIRRNPVEEGTYLLYAAIADIHIMERPEAGENDTLASFKAMGIGPDTLNIK